MMAFLEPLKELIIIWPVGAIGISLAIQFTNSFKRYFTGSIYRFIERTALSTYSIYLFHPYFIFIAGLMASGLSSVLVLFLVIIIGIPLAILIPPIFKTW
jgi:peptidoglycan/LPS O-acetylase OafA/YrhL